MEQVNISLSRTINNNSQQRLLQEIYSKSCYINVRESRSRNQEQTIWLHNTQDEDKQIKKKTPQETKRRYEQLGLHHKQGWTQVLAKCKKLLLLIRHLQNTRHSFVFCSYIFISTITFSIHVQPYKTKIKCNFNNLTFLYLQK